MKKMMMIVAAIAMVGMVQAAQVRWSMANNAVTWLTPANNTATIGQQYYLINAASSAAIIAEINAGTFSGASAGVLDIGSASTTKGFVAARTPNYAPFAVGTTYNLAVLVFDQNALAANYYQISSSIGQLAWDGTTDIGAAANFSAPNFNVANWTAVVPEPTSMALLALGAAAIGLRRRFRK
jgi:hypothetical protein